MAVLTAQGESANDFLQSDGTTWLNTQEGTYMLNMSSTTSIRAAKDGSGYGNIKQLLLAFDTSAIPVGSTITSATLSLTFSSTYSSTGLEHSIHVLAPHVWLPTATTADWRSTLDNTIPIVATYSFLPAPPSTRVDLTSTADMINAINPGGQTEMIARLDRAETDTLVANDTYDAYITVALTDPNTAPLLTVQYTEPVSPPSAPTLISPANQSTQSLSGGFIFEWQHNSNTAALQSEYSFRRRIEGTVAWEYWDAGTSSWSASEVWNRSSQQSINFPAGAWDDSVTYEWTVATAEEAQ